MGTDIHLEVERKLDDGTWDRIIHMFEPCWNCGEYDRESGLYINQTGEKHIICRREEMLPDDQEWSERKPSDNDWVILERMGPCETCKGTLRYQPQFFKERNYDVFAIFGNVRNGSGFAGTRTSSGFDPISDNRGLPDDLSQSIRDRNAFWQSINYDDAEDADWEDPGEKLEREDPEGVWDLGEHSFSWITLQELLDYDWSNGVIKEGWVTPGQFQEFRERGAPSSWSGGVSGSMVEHISDTEMADRIDSGDIQFVEDEPGNPFDGRPYTTALQRSMGDWDLPEGSVGAKIRDRNSLYCLIKWPHASRDSVGPGFWQQVEHLKELAPHGDYSRVRLVFGFDS